MNEPKLRELVRRIARDVANELLDEHLDDYIHVEKPCKTVLGELQEEAADE